MLLLTSAMGWVLWMSQAVPGFRDALIPGLLFGLACSTKYTAVLLFPALAWVILRIHGPSTLPKLIAAGVAACAAFAMLNPYMFLNRSETSGTILHIFNVFYRSSGDDPVWLKILAPLRHGPGGYVGLLLAAVALIKQGSPVRIPLG